MKAKINTKTAPADVLMTLAANQRGHKRVVESAARFAMNLLILLFGTALQLQCKTTDPTSTQDPIQRKPNSPFQGIGDLPGGRIHSEALGISDDGNVITGRSSSARFDEEGFFCIVRDSLVVLQVLQGSAGAPVSSEPRALTPNGEINAGKIASARGIEAARWTAATGWIGLGDIPGGTFASQALGICADGTVLVGWGASNAGFEAARWVNGNALAMGDLLGGTFHSIAFDLSADGAIVVGFGNTAQGAEAFIWDATNGMRNLKSVLVAGGMQEAERWWLTEATGISAGGRIIIGNGTNPSGQTEGWIAELP